MVKISEIIKVASIAVASATIVASVLGLILREIVKHAATIEETRHKVKVA